MPSKNKYELIKQGSEYFTDRPVLVSKIKDKWQKMYWEEFEANIHRIAQGLIALGLNKSNSICILSNTRMEWTLIDLAIIACGAITVPIYHSSTPSECEHIINDSEAKMIFVENQEQLTKIEQIKNTIPHITQVIIIAESVTEKPSCTTLKELMESDNTNQSQELLNRISNLQSYDIASFIYTSGTTGLPKGTVLTHENIIAHVIGTIQVLPPLIGYDTIQFLPFAHVFARGVQYIFLHSGVTQWYAERFETLSDNLLEANPHFFVSVPRLFEKIYAKILSNVESSSSLKKRIFIWAVSIGHDVSQLIQHQKPLSLALTIQYKIAKTLVFNKIKARLGKKIQFVVSGGAPLSKSLVEFFHALDILILEGYGLTETTSATHINQMEHFKFGTVGLPIAGIEVKLADDDEILMRGKNIMLGYYKNEELSHQVIDSQGWFSTGDIGHIDSDGFLTIIDRKKEIIITSAGKNIPPQKIENLLKNSPFINEVMIYGNKRNFLSALIIIEDDMTSKWAKDHNIPFQDYTELTRKTQVIQLIDHEIEKINQTLAQYETIKKFAILDRELSQDHGELTPTLKLKRKKIIENHQKLLDQFYGDRFN